MKMKKKCQLLRPNFYLLSLHRIVSYHHGTRYTELTKYKYYVWEMPWQTGLADRIVAVLPCRNKNSPPKFRTNDHSENCKVQGEYSNVQNGCVLWHVGPCSHEHEIDRWYLSSSSSCAYGTKETPNGMEWTVHRAKDFVSHPTIQLEPESLFQTTNRRCTYLHQQHGHNNFRDTVFTEIWHDRQGRNSMKNLIRHGMSNELIKVWNKWIKLS